MKDSPKCGHYGMFVFSEVGQALFEPDAILSQPTVVRYMNSNGID